ncbi:MAG: hypothetical protein HN945_14110 [Deltaproteobacteria bacterium]|nr:hypothetical protein [Deltaproteobacteria bacterium]
MGRKGHSIAAMATAIILIAVLTSHVGLCDTGSKKIQNQVMEATEYATVSNPPVGIKPILQKITMAPPLEHKKRVYVDENKAIYWPMEQPVWIRLATGPDTEASSFLLQTPHDQPDEKAAENQEDGIRLEIPGRQFVRWVNHLTKEETLYRFYTDRQPPNCSIRLTGAPVFASLSRQYYGSGLKGSIVASDALSGVRASYVSINGEAFKPYEEVMSFESEKDYHVRYYAVDQVGYAGSPKTVMFTVDKTPPESLHRKQFKFVNDTLSSKTILTLAAADSLSGVKRLYYRLSQDSDFKVYRNYGIRIEDLKDGKHTLEYFGEDNVKNLEKIKKYPFYLDRIPPTLDSKFDGDYHQSGKQGYISKRTKIILTATDSKVKVKGIHYSLGNETNKEYQSAFYPQVNSGPIVVRYAAFDELDNLSPQKEITVTMDGKAPQTGHTISGPAHSQGGGASVWITNQTLITLSASDNASGVRNIMYQIASDKPQPYTAPIQLEKEGKYLLRYWGIDNVNNREASTSVLLIVDRDEPGIIIGFGLDPIEIAKEEKGEDIPKYLVNTPLILAAYDKSSGLQSLEYSLNGASLTPYQQLLVFQKPGIQEVRIRARDHVGNSSEKILKFNIVNPAL